MTTRIIYQIALFFFSLNSLSQTDELIIDEEPFCYVLNGGLMDRIHSNAMNIVANQWGLELCYYDNGCLLKTPEELQEMNKKGQLEWQAKYGEDWEERLSNEALSEKETLLELEKQLKLIDTIKDQRDKLNSLGIGVLFSYEKELKPKLSEYIIKGYGRKYSKGEYEDYFKIYLDYINGKVENVKMKILKDAE